MNYGLQVYPQDFEEILSELIVQRWSGFEYVSFEKEFPSKRWDLEFHVSQQDAIRKCEKESSGDLQLGYLPTKFTGRTMSQALSNPALIKMINGAIDVGAMVEARETKLEQEAIKNNLNNNIMNQDNREALTKKVFFTGFEGMDEKFNEAANLAESRKSNTFSIEWKDQKGNDTVEAKLNFRKPDELDYTFFNSYNMTIKDANGKITGKQNFKIDNKSYRDADGNFLNKHPNITQKEAYNLMKGRAVHKDVTDGVVNDVTQFQKAWVQLNFREADAKGNFKKDEITDFNLADHLNKLPIKELLNEQYKASLIESIEKGNRQLVTFVNGETESKGYIEANPKFDTINLYDESMQRLSTSQNNDVQVSQAEGQNIFERKMDDAAQSESSSKNESVNKEQTPDGNSNRKSENSQDSKQQSEPVNAEVGKRIITAAHNKAKQNTAGSPGAKQDQKAPRAKKGMSR